MKSVIAVAVFTGLAAAWGPGGPPSGPQGSWGTATGGPGGSWGSQQTWTPTAWTTSAPTTYTWNATTHRGPTGTVGTAGSSGVGVWTSTGSPIATGGVDSSKPMVGGLLAIAGVLAAL